MVVYKRDPYKNQLTEAYCTAINILAVEYLIKQRREDEYSRRVDQVTRLDEDELNTLYWKLSLNMHTSTLGAMITQGDYDYQREALLSFLDEIEEDEEETCCLLSCV